MPSCSLEKENEGELSSAATVVHSPPALRLPIFVSHRTPKEIQEARNLDWHTLPDPQPDDARVKEGHDQWLILIGICTHLGCIPLAHQGDYDGWFCPCHGSQYDTSGRIRRGPAPANLPLPPYAFLSDTKVRIG